MRADAGRVRVDGYKYHAEGMRVRAGRGEVTGFACTGKRKARRGLVEKLDRKPRLGKALPRGAHDGRKTLLDTEAQIRRPSFAFTQRLASAVAEPRAAACAAAVHAKKKARVHCLYPCNPGYQRPRTGKDRPRSKAMARDPRHDPETERLSPRYTGIDVWGAPDVIDALIEAQFSAVAAVRSARPAIEGAALAMADRLRGAGRLIYAGAGTSGRLAVQDGAELMPTFNWPQERLLLLIAGGKEALIRALEGSEDQIGHAAELAGQHCIASGDVLVAVAASGTTPFTLACLREAKARGALTVGIANNRDTPVLTESDYPVFLETGAEPIAGSTRMKAGTAQRIALLLLSSLVMIRFGRVHGGLMVDVQAVNDKLVRRSENMLRDLTGRDGSEVRDALREAKGNVKVAALLLRGCSAGHAAALLERAEGRLREALALADTDLNGR
jgi:N-acetylmuramic acid 6-phosphate etherase